MAEEGGDSGNEGFMEERTKTGRGIPLAVYFKEESNVVTDLDESQQNALAELKELLLAEFFDSKNRVAEEAEDEDVAIKMVYLWGAPLVGDEKSNAVLLKFLRARDFKVKESLEMIKNTVVWREEFGIEGLLEEELGMEELEKVVFMQGEDKEGHPVCYNAYGEFGDEDLYRKIFTDEEKRKRFMKWRIQFLERGIRERLDFNPGGICSMVQVTDLKNSPVLGKKEFRQATKEALAIFQDNYPEFVAKKIFINVPWWYLAFNRMISPFFTQRTKSKFVFARPSKSSETLFQFIAPEQVPVQYGGLGKKSDIDFCVSDSATEVSIKPFDKHTIEIPVSEPCVIVWELRVLGWDVSCGAEFVPCAEDGYTVIVQKIRKLTAVDESLLKNCYRAEETGKIIFTIENPTSKKKKLLYRTKAKSVADSTSMPKKSP